MRGEPVLLAGGDEVSGALEQVGADGGQAMLLGEGAVVESVEQAEPGRGAVFGTLAAAVYRIDLHDAPSEARESVAGATAAARVLPPGAAHQLLDAAHGAFGSAITVVAVAGMAVFAVLRVVCRRAASRRSGARHAGSTAGRAA